MEKKNASFILICEGWVLCCVGVLKLILFGAWGEGGVGGPRRFALIVLNVGLNDGVGVSINLRVLCRIGVKYNVVCRVMT